MIAGIKSSADDDSSPPIAIDDVFHNPARMQAVLDAAALRVRREYEFFGLPLVGAKDGRIVWCDPVTLNEVPQPTTAKD